jgi:microcystin-dependent protein
MATLLPLGKQQFLSNSGVPLAGGSVAFYIPSTLTPKTTWQDAQQTIANTNPITLDAAGEAIIYGSGSYRQIVTDAAGNTIWDQLTSDTASGGTIWGGTSTGTANVQVITAGGFTQTDGQIVSFLAGATNTSQLTINGIPLLRDSVTGPTPLTGGDVVAANGIQMIYDAARGAFHLVQNNQLTPSGQVAMYAMATPPAGWLECDGSSVLRATYPALFAAIGTTYGSADGTHFTLPDARGYFARAWDHGAGRDSGRALGSTQTDLVKAHNHTATSSVTDPGHLHAITDPGHNHSFKVANVAQSGGGGGVSDGGSISNTTIVNNTTGITVNSTTTGITVATTTSNNVGAENRPINISFMFAIKF